MVYLDIYVTWPPSDPNLSDEINVFDITITSYFAKWTLGNISWKEISNLRSKCEEDLGLKTKYLKELTDPKELPGPAARCQEIQDFFHVLLSNPKHYIYEEIHEFLELIWQDPDTGIINENHLHYLKGKVELDNQIKGVVNDLIPKVEVMDSFIVYCLSPSQCEPGTSKSSADDDEHVNRKYVRRKIKLMNDGRIIINRIVGKKGGRHHLRDVFLGCCRVEDVVAARYLEFGHCEHTVAIHLGRRFWAFSFDTGPKAKSFLETMQGQRANFLKVFKQVIVEDAPLHLVGVVQRQLDEINKLVSDIYTSQAKNEAIELDIKQWQDIINTEHSKLNKKREEIHEHFQKKIDAEKQAAAIQNGFNEAIFKERQKLLKSIVDPDVFERSNFKEINKIIGDGDKEVVTDGKYNTALKGTRWIAHNHHFHHHLTIHKHIYHHYPPQNLKKGDDKVARETHSYTKTYTQTIIDLKRNRKIIPRKGEYADNTYVQMAADFEDTINDAASDLDSILGDVTNDLTDAFGDDDTGAMPVSGGR